MEPTRSSRNHTYPVLDTLEKTRLEHDATLLHSDRISPTTTHPLNHIGTSVADHILQQVEAKTSDTTVVNSPHEQQQQQDHAGRSNPMLNTPVKDNHGLPSSSHSYSSNGVSLSQSPPKSGEEGPIIPSRAPGSSWQSLASMSSNQLPSETVLDPMNEHEHEHEKPSVLPEIFPGFKGRMADIHHATLKSVTDGTGAAVANHHTGR